MQDFPANSHRAKATEAPREKLAPVTSAKVDGRKRGLGRQFKDTFFSGSARDAGGYMIESVIIPAIRDTVHEAMRAGLERLIYGDRGGRPRPGRVSWMESNTGHVNYQGMSRAPTTRPPVPQQRTLSRQARARNSTDELVIPSRQEAEEVIDRMYDLLSRYGTVSVAELYELTGVQSSHTDMKWGWANLRGAKALRLRQGGFLLDLPEPEALT